MNQGAQTYDEVKETIGADAGRHSLFRHARVKIAELLKPTASNT